MSSINAKTVDEGLVEPGSGSGSKSQAKKHSGIPRFGPDIFGKYYLLQRIGIGGMAEVIRAKTVGAGGFQKELVIKRVLPQFAKDESFVRMFVNEAKITVGLTHPNIAQILEFGEHQGVYFMSIELIDGVDLTAFARLFREKGSTLSIDDAVWLILETLKGLDHAHRRVDPLGHPLGIVHCDISPDNIMVTFDAGVKILDFGIARLATNLSNRREGMVMGKVNYLSPEQALGKDVDHRSDVYSAGVVLYNLVTGKYPYGRFKDLQDLVPLVSGAVKYHPADEIDPRVPKDLDLVLQKAVHVDPKKRFSDARAFMMALEEVLYPTPHSSIAEHIRARIEQGFADRKSRLARLRANDTTVMRILARRAEGTPQEQTGESISESLGLLPPPVEQTPSKEYRELAEARKRRKWSMVPWWHITLPQTLIAVLLALIMVGTWEVTRAHLFDVGVVVVESEPPGAEVFFNNSLVPGVTPLVVQDVRTKVSHDVVILLDDYDSWEGRTAGDGNLLQSIYAEPVRRFGPVVVTSTPRNAEVLVNDELVGRTPVTIDRIDLVGPTKIGLRLPNHEVYEMVLWDTEAGLEVHHEFERRRLR